MHCYVEIRGQCMSANTSSEMLHEVYCLFTMSLNVKGIYSKARHRKRFMLTVVAC